MTAADSLFAAPHEDRCAEAVLWTSVRCVRSAGHVGGCVGVLSSFAPDRHDRLSGGEH